MITSINSNFNNSIFITEKIPFLFVICIKTIDDRCLTNYNNKTNEWHNFVTVKPSTDSITVSWAPPNNPNVMVRGYTIGWGKGIPDAYSRVLDGKQRYYILEGLGKYCFNSNDWTIKMLNNQNNQLKHLLRSNNLFTSPDSG